MEIFPADEATNGTGSRTQTSTILNACHEVNKDVQSKRTSLEVEPAIADGPRPTLQLIMQTDNAPIYGVTRDDLFEVFREFYEKILEETQNEADQKMISVKEAAYMLGVDRSTLWRWEKKGYLIPARIGRKVLYRMADIKKIIN